MLSVLPVISENAYNFQKKAHVRCVFLNRIQLHTLNLSMHDYYSLFTRWQLSTLVPLSICLFIFSFLACTIQAVLTMNAKTVRRIRIFIILPHAFVFMVCTSNRMHSQFKFVTKGLQSSTFSRDVYVFFCVCFHRNHLLCFCCCCRNGCEAVGIKWSIDPIEMSVLLKSDIYTNRNNHNNNNGSDDNFFC